MPGLLGSLFSTIDSAKRKLSDVAANPQLSLMQMVGDANDRARGFNELGDAALAENLASGRFGGPSNMALAEKLADSYGMGGITLLHGGPVAISKVDPNQLMQSVHSTGFHTTNKIATPYTFATRGGRQGVISAFDFPDELYEKTLRLNAKPIGNYPDVESSISKMVGDDPALREDFMQRLKSLYQAERAAGGSAKPADLATGERVSSWLRKFYGGMNEADPRMAAAGIPGRTWQYSAERPSEMATAIFPEYMGELRPLGQVTVAPGNMMQASKEIKALLELLGENK